MSDTISSACANRYKVGERLLPESTVLYVRCIRRDARAAESGGLENRCVARYRGFESPSLRKSFSVYSNFTVKAFVFGKMSEWSMVQSWKGCVPQGTEGSNPSLSVKPFVMSSGPMQRIASGPRQIRKEAAAGRQFLCRSVPELFREGLWL